MSRCGDCAFYEKCSKECRGLDKNEEFPEIGGCEAFQLADDKTRQERKMFKRLAQYAKEKKE